MNLIDIGSHKNKEYDVDLNMKVSLKLFLTRDMSTPGFYQIAEQELLNINKLIEDYLSANNYSVNHFTWEAKRGKSNVSD